MSENSGMNLNPLWGDLATLRKLFPDARYVRAVARRQALFAAAVAVVVAPFTVLSALTKPLAYSSMATIAFDPRDASGDALASIEIKQLAERFQSVRDRRFLEPLVANVQLTPETSSPPMRLIEAAADRLRRLYGTEAANAEAEKRQRDAALAKLSASIDAWADEEAMLLRLAVTAETPELARAWTVRIAESYIQNELKLELARVDALDESYAAAAPEKPEANGSGKPASEDAQRIAKLQEREVELLDQIQLARTETSEATSAVARRRAELQGELARLKTTLGSSHPDVVAKEEEVRDFMRGSGGGGGRGSRALQEELGSVRAKLRLFGAPSAGESTSGYDVHTRLLRLKVDKSHLERQLRNPAFRTRLRLVQQPYLPSSPRKGRSALVLTALMTTLALAGGLAASREALSPRATDAWRIASATRLSPLAIFSWGLVRRAADLTPERLDRLRSAISERKMLSSTPVRLFLEYRQLVRVLQHQCVGRKILFVSAGEGERLATVLFDFFRIYAVETGEPTVVVDLDFSAPLSTQRSVDGPTAAHGGDVCDLLAATAKWQDVRVLKTLERPFDLVPPPPELSAEKVRGLKKPQTQKLTEALERSYKTVFIRGLKAQHVLENAAFVGAVTDIVLVVDGKTARRDEVVRAADDLGRDLVRGFILVED